MFKKITGFIFCAIACVMLFTVSSCSLINKDMSRDDTIELYDSLSKTYFGEYKNEGDYLKFIASIPVKQLEIYTKTSVKEDGVVETTDEVSKMTVIKSGDVNSLCFEITMEKNDDKENHFYYLKDGKYYTSVSSKYNNAEEITQSDFETAVAFSYILGMVDIKIASETGVLVGTSQISEGFKSAVKGIKDIVITCEVKYETTTITLKKNKVFKDEYELQEVVKIDKSVVDSVTTTTETRIKFSN